MFDDENEEPRIDLTSLIDVIFMLVIFFMMTMTFSSKPVLDIVLPESTQAKARRTPCCREGGWLDLGGRTADNARWARFFH